MPRSRVGRAILTGLILSLLTVLLGVVVAVTGLLADRWDWRAIAFTLSVVEVLILGAIAVVDGPFEPRMRRWDAPRDPLAIGFQLDLAAAEQNAPRPLAVGPDWLWIALLPFVTTIVLGISII